MTKNSTVIAFDVGLRRTGVAVGDQMTGSARALTTIKSNAAGEFDWPSVDHILAEWTPGTIVVGLPPETEGGGEKRIAIAARQFGTTMKEHTKSTVVFVDETLTSAEAEQRLRAQRVSGRRTKKIQKSDIDAMAAAVILETWLQTKTTS